MGSILRLKNKSHVIIIDPVLEVGFEPNIPVDLLELGHPIEDFLGRSNGRFFDYLLGLIKSNLWCLNDGESDLSISDGCYLLKYGDSPTKKARIDFNGNKYVTFESCNFLDPSTWPNGDPTLIVAPFPNTTLWVHHRRKHVWIILFSDKSRRYCCCQKGVWFSV
jgi:hypothetical protein